MKNTKKDSEKKHKKNIKLFLKKKKTKGKKKAGQRYQNFTEEEKNRQYHCECNKNYYSEEQQQKQVE